MKNNKWLIIFLFIFTSNLFAQQQTPWWLSLEQGKQKFRAGDYSGALLSFEDARRNRRSMYEKMERDFITFLSRSDVRRIGDSLERVEWYSYEQRYTLASAALEELFYRIPKRSFNNSATAALAGFSRLKDYPEAEYWIGEIFRIEGELSLALSQYRRAYSMRGNLEDPGFSTTILYKIANVQRTRQEYVDMENVLLSIIADKDTLWTNAMLAENTTGRMPHDQASAAFARNAMAKTLTDYGINRFMVMYRYNNSSVEPAHRILGLHYAVQGRAAAEQHLMFAFLIQNTIIIEEVRRRQFDFLYTDLSALAREINNSQLLLSYVDEVEYYKTVYYFGISLFRNGKTAAARTLWNFLASQPQAGEWHNRSVSQLRNPRLEPIVIMP